MKRRAGILGVLCRSSEGSVIERWNHVVVVVGVCTIFFALVVCRLLLVPSVWRDPFGDVMSPTTSEFFSASPPQLSPSPKNFSILMGVFTTVHLIERRNIIRLAYGLQSTDVADVTVRFVVGLPKNESEGFQLGLENSLYGDILVLDMVENMNEGKTWKYFSTVYALGVHYDYVMKVDDDSYVRIDNLASSLAVESRTDLYYGYLGPCGNNNLQTGFMAGMGYALSWDLIEWVSTSEIVLNNTGGYGEDLMTRDWFNQGGKAKNRVSKRPFFYDHPDAHANGCSHPLNFESILIHRLKSTERWMATLKFFEYDRVGINGSTIAGYRSTLAGNESTPVGNAAALAGNETAVAGKRSTPVGNEVALAGNETALAGNGSTLFRDKAALAGNETALARDGSTQSR
ncbi:hypothetical protein M758_11G016700 [Ceratodon purpureus]|uniref:Hexosyltransferase n=1 Tax=Ceratodon purpureus TaxID=3225 RepID=A0A8T0GFN0_CERPU|nr:hypothetical protein KC19_11G018400 [Ceratodon purpureus]KAG0600218.1 hypothetical protein M758_11G016700 [Ceratodon purpureus]